jgi:hypothetical protein
VTLRPRTFPNFAVADELETCRHVEAQERSASECASARQVLVHRSGWNRGLQAGLSRYSRVLHGLSRYHHIVNTILDQNDARDWRKAAEAKKGG